MREDIYDVKWQNIPRYMTFLPRFVLMWTGIMICGFSATFTMLIYGKDEVPESTWQVIKAIIMFTAKWELKASGYSKFELKRKDVCYKKYLGPDWKPKYSGAPTLIANHRSWCDIGVGVGHFCACFVAADRVR